MSLLAHARLVAAARLQPDRRAARVERVFKGDVTSGAVLELETAFDADAGAELYLIEYVVPEHVHDDPVATTRFAMAVIDPRRDAFAAADIERAARSKFRL